MLCNNLQYLKFAEFEETAKVFEKEAKRKGKAVLKRDSRRDSKIIGLHVRLLSHLIYSEITSAVKLQCFVLHQLALVSL